MVSEFRLESRGIGLTVFRPAEEHGSGALLWASGAHASGASNASGSSRLAQSLADKLGMAVVLVAYRFGTEDYFPTGLTDVYMALEWMRRPDGPLPSGTCIALGGDGIGGGLAAGATILAKRYGAPRPTALVLLAPFLDARMSSPSWKRYRDESQDSLRQLIAGAAPGVDRSDPLLSPLLARDIADFPPTVIVTAELDPLRDDGERFAQKLLQEGVPVLGHRYPQVTHSEASDGGASETGRRVLTGMSSALDLVLSRQTASH